MRLERQDEGFLGTKRYALRARYPDGSTSAPFPYDVVTRAALDAVVIVAHFRDRAGATRVLLRSALRPPVALREIAPRHHGRLWEVPAGLVEPGESPRAAAARELEEELGVVVPRARLRPLGPWSIPAPAVLGERHVFFHVEIDPPASFAPSGDGSALERHARVIAAPLDEALAWARAGKLPDAKTELALRRLAELASAPAPRPSKARGATRVRSGR